MAPTCPRCSDYVRIAQKDVQCAQGRRDPRPRLRRSRLRRLGGDLERDLEGERERELERDLDRELELERERELERDREKRPRLAFGFSSFVLTRERGLDRDRSCERFDLG